MQALFIEESEKNKNMPIGGGLWSTAMSHPEDAPRSSATEWTFEGPMTGMSESAAPKLGIVDTLVSMDVDMPANASGVLYSLGGFSGGLTCYMKNGVMTTSTTSSRSCERRSSPPASSRRARSRLKSNRSWSAKSAGHGHHHEGQWQGRGTGPGAAAISLHFTTNESLDFGSDTFSPVSLDYYDQAPFAFNGKIGTTRVSYPKKGGADQGSNAESAR